MEFIVQITLNGIIAGALYALIAVSFNLIYGVTKFFNITHGVMAAIGAYAVFFFAKGLGFPVVISILIGILCAGAVGWALDRFLYRPLRKKKASQLVLLVASLGAFTVLQAVLAILFTSQFQTLTHTVSVQNTLTIFGGIITTVQAGIIISAIVVTACLVLFLRYTRFGMAVRAVRDDVEVARMTGINVDAVIGSMFFIGSAIAGFAGILVGYDTAIEPTMGLALLLKGVIAAIVGGVGSVYGGFLGAFLLGLVENFAIIKISGEWKDAIAFALLILFLLFRPRGIIRT